VSFEGFPDEGLVFYEGLEADNTKTYWTRGKSSYEAHVRAPLLAMLEELAPEFGTAKVFRPYRDVRFSNDKTPYKTHQGAVIHHGGARPPGTCRSRPTGYAWPVAAGAWSPTRWPGTGVRSRTRSRVRGCRRRSTGCRGRAGDRR